MKYVDKTYRLLYRPKDLAYFKFTLKETDLYIAVEPEIVNDAMLCLEKFLINLRGELEKYISLHPEFLNSFVPCETLIGAPEIAKDMAKACKIAGVGPMAAVAGAFSHYIGEYLRYISEEVVVENGGDIYIHTKKTRRIAVFAADSPFSQRIALEVYPEEMPLGICTSSGTVGHSISFGTADAVVVVARSAVLADAVATAAANKVKCFDDLETAVKYAVGIGGVLGSLAICKDKMAVCGKIKLIPI